MKDSVTKFDFDDAFKALDEIEIPVAEKGIKANRIDLKESMRKVDKFELLFEDFYDVGNADDMNTASEEREAEVAKAKLARIEKIVDLDAETEDDILPSYVGKTIIQCPQCMTLFYKNAEDIVRDEENPEVVNVNEVCQHCGNESGYDVVGKVAEETESVPGEELGTDDFNAEVGDGENDIAIDDGSETAPAEGGEVDELSAEADTDSLDLNLDLDDTAEEENTEEDEEEIKEESLNTSELLKKIEDKNDLKTENESEKLTLNEDIEDNLDTALKDHEEYIDYLRNAINQEEAALSKATNEQVKQAIQKRIDAFREDLEAALPDAVKAEAQEEELPDAEEAGLEDATDNTVEEEEVAEVEETTESLHEAVESMTDTLNRAWEVAKRTNSPIGVTVVTLIGAGTMGKLKEWSKTVNANLYYVDAKNPDLMANGFDENMISRPDTVIVIDEFDRATTDTQKAIGDEISVLADTVEMAIVISNNDNLNGDTFKPFKQFVVTMDKETTESLTEDVSMKSSPENFKKLLDTKEFKEPISPEEVESYFEGYIQNEPNTDPIESEISIDEPVSRGEIDELADIDEESFNNGLTESLKQVYENVNNFTMTDCELNENILSVTGNIEFNSGKTKATTYIFEAKNIANTHIIRLQGTNKDLFETGSISITGKILEEKLYADIVKYKYNISQNLVEGCIYSKKKAQSLTEDTLSNQVLTEASEVTSVADKLANTIAAGGYKHLYVVPFLTPNMVSAQEKNTVQAYRQYPYIKGIKQYDLGNDTEQAFKANIKPDKKITKVNTKIFSKIETDITRLGTTIVRGGSPSNVKADVSTSKVTKLDLVDDVAILAIWILLSNTPINVVEGTTIKPKELMKLVQAGVNNKDLSLVSIYYPKNKKLDTSLEGKGLDARAARALVILKDNSDSTGVVDDNLEIESETDEPVKPVVDDKPVEAEVDSHDSDSSFNLDAFFIENKEALKNKKLVIFNLNSDKTRGIPVKFAETDYLSEATSVAFDKCRELINKSNIFKQMDYTYGIFLTKDTITIENKVYEMKDFNCLATYNQTTETLAKEAPVLD